MPSDLEWIDPSGLQAADGVDHLDFGPRRPPPAWLSRTTRPRRVPHRGWLSVAAVAMTGALLFGPSVRHTQSTGHKPAGNLTEQSCQVVIVHTVKPGNPIFVATDGHVVLVRKTQCGFAPTP